MGLNAEVWHCIREELGSHFTLHLVDLPGYGRSTGFGAMTLEEMTAQVAKNAPDQAICSAGAWAGWWRARWRSYTLNAFRRW
ncbi:biotin biosynthesis protein [Salmonella enterica subsp. arizonae]|uniref:Biotin biosynthesis protein n=1 Tax=Salmonella enterica subsp. arizonae TaxID=59203 RepID=A0A2X4SWW9_SALER|nr:biotin biosynthesis protein [Salmonella enterica subsp. arizonae]